MCVCVCVCVCAYVFDSINALDRVTIFTCCSLATHPAAQRDRCYRNNDAMLISTKKGCTCRIVLCFVVCLIFLFPLFVLSHCRSLSFFVRFRVHVTSQYGLVGTGPPLLVIEYFTLSVPFTLETGWEKEWMCS